MAFGALCEKRSQATAGADPTVIILKIAHETALLSISKIPFRLGDLPVGVQLVVFGHYFNSFGGYFRPCMRPFAVNAQAANARLGPTALLLANKTIYNAALGVALQTRTTLFCGSLSLVSFMRKHTECGTARHIRRLTISLNWACELGDYEMPVSRIRNSLPKVETTELQVSRMMSTYFTVGLERAQSSCNALCHYSTLQALPTRLKYYTIRCPEIERPLQRALNELTCATCLYTRLQEFFVMPNPFVCLFGRSQHSCAQEVLLSDFARLDSDERMALARSYSTSPELHTVVGALAAYLDAARDRVQDVAFGELEEFREYDLWQALGRPNAEMAGFLERRKEKIPDDPTDEA